MLNIIIGSGSTVGDWLVTDPAVAMITFTGSHPVGKYIMSRGGLKKYTMELGSNSAIIICENVDLDQAIPRSMFGSYDNLGQICISIQRIYVHNDILKQFTDQFVTMILMTFSDRWMIRNIVFKLEFKRKKLIKHSRR